MAKIVIDSFKGGLANDRNVGQEGAFWNSSNIEYRRNSSYIELAKAPASAFTVTSGIPTALAFWENGSTITTDLVAFTNNGKIFTTAGLKYTIALGGSVVNIAEANGKKYLIGAGHLHEFVNTTSVTEGVKTFAASSTIRPVINFYGDLIIGNGTYIIRYNIDGTLQEWTSGTTSPVIGGLDGTIYAITQVGPSIFVWCNNGTDTVLYIWDGVSTRPSQKIKYSDMPVKNVALLGNQHYWYAYKSDSSIRNVLIGESYAPQKYIKSDYPAYTLETEKDNEKNRMAIISKGNDYINAIETVGDIVYMPGMGRIFGFGRYYPGDKFSFSNDFTITGTLVTAMSSGGTTLGNRDAGGFLAVSIQNGSTYDVSIINLGQSGTNPGITYASSGFIESMEYMSSVGFVGEDNKKILFDYNLPSSATSIKVYYKMNRASSYTETKTITYTDSGNKFAEVSIAGNWKTIQFKFELITTDSSVTPKLYLPIHDITAETWQR